MHRIECSSIEQIKKYDLTLIRKAHWLAHVMVFNWSSLHLSSNSCFKCEVGEITYDLHTILDVLDIHRGPHIGCEWVSSYLLIRMFYGNTHFNIQLAKFLRVILPIYYWKSPENVGKFLMDNFPVWQISIGYQSEKASPGFLFPWVLWFFWELVTWLHFLLM